jgi:hypothetical protein
MPPAGIAGLSFFGFSATNASVVISNEATEAASCSAVRTTFAGSMCQRAPRTIEIFRSFKSRVVADRKVEALQQTAGVLSDGPDPAMERFRQFLLFSYEGC